MYENEIWKDIPHYEGRYLVSNYGRVFSLLKKRIMAIQISNDGYAKIRLVGKNGKRNTEMVHRLVAMAFIPNEEQKPQVNHINCIRNDNRVENLEWVTHQENQAYKWKTSNQEKIRSNSRQMMKTMNRKHYGYNPVVCVETGEIFESTYEAEKAKGGHCENIKKVCDGERNTCNGYHWKWYQKEKEN